MAIVFMEFVRPHGRRREIEISRSETIEQKAQELKARNLAFEIEELMTRKISMEILDPKTKESYALEICDNGPKVLAAVDLLVETAHQKAFGGLQ